VSERTIFQRKRGKKFTSLGKRRGSKNPRGRGGGASRGRRERRFVWGLVKHTPYKENLGISPGPTGRGHMGGGGQKRKKTI